MMTPKIKGPIQTKPGREIGTPKRLANYGMDSPCIKNGSCYIDEVCMPFTAADSMLQ